MLDVYFFIEKLILSCTLVDKPPPVEPVYENTSKKAENTTNSDTNLVNNLEICM